MSFYVKIEPNDIIKVLDYSFQYIGVDIKTGKLLMLDINKPLNEGLLFIDSKDIKKFRKTFGFIEQNYTMQYNYFEVKNKFPTCNFIPYIIKFDKPIITFEDYK